MKKLKQLLSTLALIASPFAVQAAYWAPQIGADYKYWGVVPYPENQFSADYNDVFPRINNALNFYVGTRINGFFGVDIGYEMSETQRKTAVYEGDEFVFSLAESPNDSTQIDLQLHTFHGEMNFYWEVVRAFELMFMMGAAYVYPKTHINHLTYATGTWYEYDNTSKPFWSGRFGFAVQYNPIPCFGYKAAITFDQIRRLNYLGSDENDVFYDIHPYRKATSFSIGFVYSFSNPRRAGCYFSD